MPDIPEMDQRDLNAIAEYIKGEKQDRVSKRESLEKKWNEVDRQIAMDAVPRETKSGTYLDWYPSVEEPLQFNALEVILADLHAMIFPKGTEWFSPLANLSDDYLERFNKRRETKPLIGKESTPFALDQEGADSLVKATMDHFHKVYEFRNKFNLHLVELIKYGMGVSRVVPVTYSKFNHEYRGVSAETIKGPGLAPTSIRNTYPDVSPHFVMHEGFLTSPTVIRCGFQLLDDMKRAAKLGGKDKGWYTGMVARMEPLGGVPPQDRRGHVEILEAEGDLIVPKSQGSIFLPNCVVLCAIGGNGARVVRLRKNPVPFRSYVFSEYLRDRLDTPYGGSPLVKNMPIQEASAFVLNDLLASGRLKVLPPVAYDRSDPKFAAMGGPDIFPGAKWATDNPAGIVPMKDIGGDVAAILQAYQILNKRSEETTGSNDPRRGAPVKSHTGTGARELEIMRGFARTQDVADDVAFGALTSILQMEYQIIRDTMPLQPVPVDMRGIEGWIELHRDDLADQVTFRVHGAAGVATARERVANFMAASQFALAVQVQAAQLGQMIDVDHVGIITEAYQNAGIQNASRFVRRAQAAPPGPPQPPAVPGDEGMASNGALEALQTLGGQLQ